MKTEKTCICVAFLFELFTNSERNPWEAAAKQSFQLKGQKNENRKCQIGSTTLIF